MNTLNSIIWFYLYQNGDVKDVYDEYTKVGKVLLWIACLLSIIAMPVLVIGVSLYELAIVLFIAPKGTKGKLAKLIYTRLIPSASAVGFYSNLDFTVNGKSKRIRWHAEDACEMLEDDLNALDAMELE